MMLFTASVSSYLVANYCHQKSNNIDLLTYYVNIPKTLTLIISTKYSLLPIQLDYAITTNQLVGWRVDIYLNGCSEMKYLGF